MANTTSLDGPTSAASLRDLTSTEAELSERDRTLTGRTVDALWESGLMEWSNPTAAEAASRLRRDDRDLDRAGLAGRLARLDRDRQPPLVPRRCAAYLPDEGFAEVFTAHDNRVTVGGQFFPNGLGETVDGGYRLTGAWNFGSGTGHSAVRGGRVHPDRRRRDGGRATTASRPCWWRSSPARRSSSPTAGTCRASRAPAATTTT